MWFNYEYLNARDNIEMAKTLVNFPNLEKKYAKTWDIFPIIKSQWIISKMHHNHNNLTSNSITQFFNLTMCSVSIAFV